MALLHELRYRISCIASRFKIVLCRMNGNIISHEGRGVGEHERSSRRERGREGGSREDGEKGKGWGRGGGDVLLLTFSGLLIDTFSLLRFSVWHECYSCYFVCHSCYSIRSHRIFDRNIPFHFSPPILDK